MAMIKNAGVLEISNRASIQVLNTDAITTLTDRIANHESGLNTNAHQIGNIAGLQTALDGKEPKIVTKGTAFNKDFGTAAGTVCQGNDGRLSDARTPLSHTHVIGDVTGLSSALSGKQDAFTGYTGSVTVVTGVNFGASTVTTKVMTYSNGVLVSVV